MKTIFAQILLTISSLFIIRAAGAVELPNILWVDPGGAGHYRSLQEAIDNMPWTENLHGEIRVVQGRYLVSQGSLMRFPALYSNSWPRQGQFNSIKGGYERVNGTRDPARFPSTIDGGGRSDAPCIDLENGHPEFSGFTISGCGAGVLRMRTVTDFHPPTARFEEMIVEGNSSLGSLVDVQGGGLSLADSIFRNNRIDGACGDGGVIRAVNGLEMTIKRTLFQSNILSCGRGAALALHQTSATISRTSFIENSVLAGEGGAIYTGEGVATTNRTMVYNSLFLRNSAREGGAVAAGDSDTILYHNNFLENSADSGRAISFRASQLGSLDVFACIIRNGGSEILNGSGELSVTYSNVQGGFSGNGNIDQDPMFQNPEHGDFHLAAGSPCINAAGDRRAISLGDFYGGQRRREWALDIGIDEAGPLERPPCEPFAPESPVPPTATPAPQPDDPDPQRPGCQEIDISLDRDSLILGPGKLRDLAARALRLISRRARLNPSAAGRLQASWKRSSKRIAANLALSEAELRALPEKILVCPETPAACSEVDHTDAIARHVKGVLGTGAKATRAVNRATRVMVPAAQLPRVRKIFQPLVAKIRATAKSLVLQAAKLPKHELKCGELRPAAAVQQVTAPIIWVDALGRGDYTTLQCAIDMAPAESEIRIVQGNYKDYNADPLFRWTFKSLKIQGGYREVEGPRDISAYPTILDGAGLHRDSCAELRFLSREAELSGLTIDNCNRGSVRLSDVESLIERVTFSNNIAADSAVVSQDGSPRFHDCVFRNNHNIAMCRPGGALSLFRALEFELIGCSFISNQTDYTEGGGISIQRSGGIIDRCLFLNNTADSSAGALSLGEGYYTNGPRFELLPITISNSLFAGNVLRETGITRGGTALWSWHGTTYFKNLTIVGHNPLEGQTVMVVEPQVINRVLMSNIISRNGGQELSWDDSAPKVRFSNIEGGMVGTGNIDSDPLFVDPQAGDYRLRSDSPSIDAGDPDTVLQEGELDLAGNPRKQGIYVDIGAYEIN